MSNEVYMNGTCQVDMTATFERFAALTRRIEEAEAINQQQTDRLNSLGITVKELAQQSAWHPGDVRRFGCKLDDPTFDNGPLLNNLLANCGCQHGNVREEIYIPGGAFYHTTPIETPARTGPAIRGNGTSYGLNEASYSGKSQRGGPVSRTVYLGQDDPRAWILNGNGTRIDGLTIQRGEWVEPRDRAKADGSIGLYVAGCDNARGVNTGHHWIPSLAILGFDCGVVAGDQPYHTHADNTHFGKLRLQNCNTGLRFENMQANGWIVDDLHVGFDCDTVVHVKAGERNVGLGGDLKIGALHLNAKSLIFKLDGRNSNASKFTIDLLNVDNNSTGWRLADAPTAGPLWLKVSGELGKKAVPGENPVNVNPSGARLDIDVMQNGQPCNWGAKP